MIREARPIDLDAIAKIYENIHAAENSGKMKTGWESGVYPVRETAEEAIRRRDMFVLEEDGCIKAAAIINKIQVDVYEGAAWSFEATDTDVCVLHTLVVDPQYAGQGIGKRFVAFYEKYALSRHCAVLRIDTNAINAAARAMYSKLGYREADVVPCEFNGISDVNLVLLEKKLR